MPYFIYRIEKTCKYLYVYLIDRFTKNLTLIYMTWFIYKIPNIYVLLILFHRQIYKIVVTMKYAIFHLQDRQNTQVSLYVSNRQIYEKPDIDITWHGSSIRYSTYVLSILSHRQIYKIVVTMKYAIFHLQDRQNMQVSFICILQIDQFFGGPNFCRPKFYFLPNFL